MLLLDAEILFDLRHPRADGEGAALAGWAQRTSRQSMFLSALSLIVSVALRRVTLGTLHRS